MTYEYIKDAMAAHAEKLTTIEEKIDAITKDLEIIKNNQVKANDNMLRAFILSGLLNIQDEQTTQETNEKEET